MLAFYEKKGRKIYVVIIIMVILFLTGMMFLSEYIIIHKNIDAMKQLQKIEQEPRVAVEKKYNGQIEYVEGDVEVRDDAESGWFSADKSFIIKNGNEVRTLNGGRTIITFEDGSSVRLDENTHIIFDNENANIRVVMDGGVVYNKVAKDHSREYIVHAGEYDITALGTEFSVQEGYDSVGIMVVESAVDIKNSGGDKIDEVQEGSKVIVQGDAVKKGEIEPKDLEEEFIVWSKDEEKKEDINNKGDSVEDVVEVFYEKGSIILSGEKSSSGVRLHWDVQSVQTPHGFKIVKSNQKDPVYPGDDYQYITDVDVRDFKWKINTGKEYYFRVCVYDGKDGCSMYSNSVFLDTPKEQEDDKNDGDYAKSISLSADKDDGNVKLKWDISGGSAPHGFKIVKSKQKDPVYPGDDYKYISDSDVRKYTWKGFKEDKTYYFRICIYKDGKCGSYSNNVKVSF